MKKIVLSMLFVGLFLGCNGVAPLVAGKGDFIPSMFANTNWDCGEISKTKAFFDQLNNEDRENALRYKIHYGVIFSSNDIFVTIGGLKTSIFAKAGVDDELNINIINDHKFSYTLNGEEGNDKYSIDNSNVLTVVNSEYGYYIYCERV